jgi:hypothetical protein
MEDNDIGDNGTGDTTIDDYLAEDASLRAPYDDIFEGIGMDGGRTETQKTTETDRATGTRGKGHPRDHADQRVRGKDERKLSWRPEKPS